MKNQIDISESFTPNSYVHCLNVGKFISYEQNILDLRDRSICFDQNSKIDWDLFNMPTDEQTSSNLESSNKNLSNKSQSAENFLEEDDRNNSLNSAESLLNQKSYKITRKSKEKLKNENSDPSQKKIKSFVKNYPGMISTYFGKIHAKAFMTKNSHYYENFIMLCKSYFDKDSSAYNLFRDLSDFIRQVNQRIQKEFRGKEEIISKNGKKVKVYKISNKEAIYEKLYQATEERLVAVNSIISRMINYVLSDEDLLEGLVNIKNAKNIPLRKFILKNQDLLGEIFNDRNGQKWQANFIY